MAKLPFFQFYPLDWLRDTRQLTRAVRGTWIDILSIAWNEPERGVYTRREDMAAHELGLEFCGFTGLKCDPENEEICEFHSTLAELSYVCEISHNDLILTIMSRRMMKDETYREYERNKKRDQRSPDDVPDLSRPCPPIVPVQKLEVRSQKLEVIKDKSNTSSKLAKLPVLAGSILFLKDLELYGQDPKLLKRLPRVFDAWSKAYPALKLEDEIRRAHAWELSNPKRQKVDRLRFLQNWLSRAQDKPHSEYPALRPPLQIAPALKPYKAPPVPQDEELIDVAQIAELKNKLSRMRAIP